MKKVKLFAGLFLREPLWFKILITGSLLLSILFSSSVFSDDSIFQGASKAAAAVFFVAWGIKLKASRGAAAAMFLTSAVCLVLAASAVYQ
ncbi:hypothetical protein [Bacillus infantis]|jgi:hypothetical protein|uniref:hypothetical protein n=1 Tax=Bacillus infantis TaxID=324767 RepID=UPI002155AD87|nr:hypothetical protein [Bacillus infantis]MCR6609099.1 hypothetical protein [Bacillus infantis]